MYNTFNSSPQLAILIKKYLDSRIVGQERYKTRMAMGVTKHLNMGIRSPIMVIGPTGSGKSFTIKCLKECEFIPRNMYSILVHDISRQVPEGICGNTLEDLMNAYKELLKSDNNRSGKGIICLDEADKILVTTGYSEIIMKTEVQNQLMNILQGEEIYGVDTSKILFVLCGAFPALDKIEHQSYKQPIGFNTQPDEPLHTPNNTIRDDLIAIGTQRELLGRITSIIKIDPLDERQLRAILLHPQNGVLTGKKNEFLKEQIELEIKDSAVKPIIEMIKRENLGARSVVNVIDQILDDCDYYAIENGYNHIVIDGESIINRAPKYSKKGKIDLQL